MNSFAMISNDNFFKNLENLRICMKQRNLKLSLTPIKQMLNPSLHGLEAKLWTC